MTVTVGQDKAKTRKTLTAGGQTVSYYSIPAAEAAGLGEFSRLPAALKVVLENMLRFEDGKTVSLDDIWDRSGARRDGYVEEVEAAWEVPAEAVAVWGDLLRALTVTQLGAATTAGLGALHLQAEPR